MLKNLNNLVQEKQIQNVLIIDDGYNSYPLAEDFEKDRDWSNFFTDLSEQQKEELSRLCPEYQNTPTEDLIDDNAFIEAIWKIFKKDEQDEPFKSIFSDFVRDNNTDLKYLKQLEALLKNLNLNISTLGEDEKELKGENNFDIIITDLFLNKSQNSIEKTINKIKPFFTSCTHKPLLILMSRSSRLDDKAKEFRDKTGSLESMFRIIEKKELIDSNKLYRILNDLIENKEHSDNILQFIESWEKGIETAAKKSINILRTIDIAEYTKIKQLLLSTEGVSTGNYIIDIMHHVLQYELEHEKEIVNSSTLLNNIQSNYLPRIRKDTNLQEIVERLHCKNSVNIPAFSDEAQIHFGDILTINNIKNVQRSLKNYTLKETNVMLVISPACDLQRCSESYNVIFLKGEKEEFTIRKWIPKADSSQIVKIDKKFYIIKWDTKNPFTFAYKYLKNNLTKENLKISARLREIPSLSLQQESLSHTGRVGVIAPMPASSNLNLSFFYKNKAEELEEIKITSDEVYFATIYTSPRTHRDKSLNKLTMGYDLCEKLHHEIDQLNIKDIHPKSQAAFNLIKNELYLESINKEEGIQVPLQGNRAITFKEKTIGFVTNKIEENTKSKNGLIICLNTD